jgi:hypothetical protein
LRLILAFLLCSSVAFAVPPTAVVTGPIDGVPGDIIELSFEESVADHFIAVVDPPRFPDGKPTFKMARDGKGCTLASRAGAYRVLLIVSNDEGPAFTWHTVKIVDVSNPTKPVDPVTPPPVDPTKPPVETLSDWVLKTTVSNVQYTRAVTGQKFADGYRLWAASGAVAKNVEEFAKAQDAINKARLLTLDASTQKEWDAFFKALATKLSSLNLTTVADAQKAWLEIADGLERAAKK